MSFILGISAFYHDSAATLLKDGIIIGACQEERLSRKKHDSCFPKRAIAYLLEEAHISIDDVELVVFYDKPLPKFERLLETYLQTVPHGFLSFVKAMPVWVKEKVFLKSLLLDELMKFSRDKSGTPKFELLFSEHHESHAAAAFYPSPFQDAAILCLDGVGEWSTSSGWSGHGKKLDKIWDINFPHSLGLLYSAFTYYCGFRVNSGEYKLMGLAPYGEPKYVDKIRKHLIDIKPDGSFALNMDYFGYVTGLRMTNSNFHKLFGRNPRTAESDLEPFHMDLARSIQVVTEDVVLRLAKSLKKETGSENLCLAGGVALNCVSNGKLYDAGVYRNIWVQPAAGDAGSALGAALLGYHRYLDCERIPVKGDSMMGSYLGPINDDESIKRELDSVLANYQRLSDDALYARTVEALVGGGVIGWCQGRMEFGPRALGGRSIIADPRSTEMQSKLNLKIKFRESFRPFAPAILAEDVSEYFEFAGDSPYMLMVAPIRNKYKVDLPANYDALFGIDKLKIPRSTLPAITHVDYSARLQTVHKETNPTFHRLITDFKQATQCPVLVNTSFNVRGEPIVSSAMDAYKCFMRTEMDYLVLGNFFLDKKKQPAWSETSNWRQEISPD